MSNITLLHGSDHIIEIPDFNFGSSKNDYGKGFYCTREHEMAREWACKTNASGFVNEYKMDMTQMNVLNLLDPQYSILNWMALLLKNRTFSLTTELSIDARDYLLEHYLIDLSTYDVVIGYRADDSYFRYAESFVTNTLSLRSLNKALRLGKLGEQTVVISKRGFDALSFVGAYPVDRSIYYPKFLHRDTSAREAYKTEVKSGRAYRDDIFVLDILREELSNDDPRIQRIISE